MTSIAIVKSRPGYDYPKLSDGVKQCHKNPTSLIREMGLDSQFMDASRSIEMSSVVRYELNRNRSLMTTAFVVWYQLS